MSADVNLELFAELEGMGLIDAKTIKVVNHFSHNGNATHAELCLELDRLDDAESDIQTLLSLAPGEPPALLLAADLYVRRGNFPAAAEILELLDARRLELPSEALEQFRALQSRVKQARAAP